MDLHSQLSDGFEKQTHKQIQVISSLWRAAKIFSLE